MIFIHWSEKKVSEVSEPGRYGRGFSTLIRWKDEARGLDAMPACDTRGKRK